MIGQLFFPKWWNYLDKIVLCDQWQLVNSLKQIFQLDLVRYTEICNM